MVEKDFKEVVKGYLRLTRIDHGIMVIIAIFAGAFLTIHYNLFNYSNIHVFLIGSLIGLILEMGTFALNDYFNIEEDRINAPHRPLVSGIIKPTHALIFSIITIILGLTLVLLLNLSLVTVVYVTILLDIMYNALLKKRGFIGNIIVAYSTAIPFVYGALLFENNPAALPIEIYLFTLVAFLATLGREVIKGIVDFEGDKKAGIKTIAITYGKKIAAYISTFTISIAIILSFLALAFIENKLLYLVFILPTDYVFISSLRKLLKNYDKKDEVEKVRKMTLAGMGLGIISFISSAI